MKIIRFVYSIHTHSPLDKLGYIAGAEEKEGGREGERGRERRRKGEGEKEKGGWINA